MGLKKCASPKRGADSAFRRGEAAQIQEFFKGDTKASKTHKELFLCFLLILFDGYSQGGLIGPLAMGLKRCVSPKRGAFLQRVLRIFVSFLNPNLSQGACIGRRWDKNCACR